MQVITSQPPKELKFSEGPLEHFRIKNTFIDGFEDEDEALLEEADDRASKTCPVMRFGAPRAPSKGSRMAAVETIVEGVPQQRSQPLEAQPRIITSSGSMAPPQVTYQVPQSISTGPPMQMTYVAQTGLTPTMQTATQPMIITAMPAMQSGMQQPVYPGAQVAAISPTTAGSIAVGQVRVSPVACQQQLQKSSVVLMHPASQMPQQGVVQQVAQAVAQPGAQSTVIEPLGVRKPQSSVGASLHGSGRCKPCAWFWKPQGCANAAACQHCHLCPEGELKNRKKAKVAVLRNVPDGGGTGED
jgi:hypothetical protein